MSQQSVQAMRRSILVEIHHLDKKIDYITKLKNETVNELLEKKQEAEEQKEVAYLNSQLDEEIVCLERQHDAAIQRQERIHSIQQEYETLQAELDTINTQLATVHERHNSVMQKLDEKRTFLSLRLKSIESLDIMKVAITDELLAEMESFDSQKKQLETDRSSLLQRTDLSAVEMETALYEKEEQIEDLVTGHAVKTSKLEAELMKITEKLSDTYDAKREDEILREIGKLQQQLATATPSEIQLIEQRILELQQELDVLHILRDMQEESAKDRFKRALEDRELHLTVSGRIQTQDGKLLTMIEARKLGLLDGINEEMEQEREREHLTQILEERGLTLTPSGRVQTADGGVYTFEEAKKLGLLDGIEGDLLRLRGLSVTASGRISTADGRLLSRSEAERLGLLDGINLDETFEAESETITESSTATTMSGLSTADGHYLKTVLGKPLTLALAEITAKQPRDPIHYLACWLYKYRHNQEVDEEKKRQLAELLDERQRIAAINLRKRAEVEVKDVLQDLLSRVACEDARLMMEAEKKRLQDEHLLMAEESEEEDLESEARDTLGVYNGPTRGQQLN